MEAALKSLQEKEEAMAESMIQLQNLREELEKLQNMYDAKMKEQEDLVKLVNYFTYDNIYQKSV